MSTITIKLKDSLAASGFHEGERVHHKAFGKVRRLIGEQLEEAKMYAPEDRIREGDGIKRCNNAISVFGERGVGKTSFLLSLRQSLQGHQENEAQGADVKEIYLLPMIDPTLIEEKGHIFLLIISLIDEAVQNVFSHDEVKADHYQRWEEGKEKLAAGLPSLKTDGMTYHEPQWNEDAYVMNKGLDSVKAAFNLEENFHKLVGLALKILDKKAFVLMFDDIDVDFQRGWALLETVRKFLTTPQIIIVISGNLKLFSKNVRKQQWRNLGKELLKNEVDVRDVSAVKEYTQLVNELEGQYLLKILNSEKRIYLYDVASNISMNGDEYQVDYGDGNPISLKDAYLDVLRSYGVQSSSIGRVFIDFLESTSMRTQVHFLYNAWRMKVEEDMQNKMSAISAFSSRIYAQNVNIDLATSENLFCSVLLHYLVREHLLEDAYQLLPTFDSTDINCVVSGFSFLYAMLVRKQPNIIFDYWVKICSTRNAMRFLSYDAGDAKQSLSIDRYCQEIGVYQKRNLRSIVGNGLAYAVSLSDKQALDGAVPLLGFGGLAKKAGMENRIDIALYDKAEQKLLGYLPLVCLLHSHKNQRKLYYSFNALLANIGQIIKTTDDNNIMQTLLTACQPVSYQIKSELSSAASADDEEDNGEIELILEDDKGIGEQVMAWKRKYENVNYCPDLFGRIATRFFYAQSSILENNKNKKLGDLFSLFTMAFFNACLIEELKSRDDVDMKGININNVSSSSDILVRNIAHLEGMNGWQEKLPFTKWMMSCPLLLPFINLEDGHNFLDFFGLCCDLDADDMQKYWSKASMTEVLNKIDIQRNRSLPTFSTAIKQIQQTIDRINNSNMDVSLIFDEEKIKEAQTQMLNIFKTITRKQIETLRSKCKISEETGKLELK